MLESYRGCFGASPQTAWLTTITTPHSLLLTHLTYTAHPPASSIGVVELAFRLPSSQRVSRRFTVASTPASHLYGFVAAAAAAAQGGGLPAGAFVICTAFPRKVGAGRTVQG